VRELELLPAVRTMLCLGAFAWDDALRLSAALDDPPSPLPRPRPRFGHASEVTVGRYTLLGSYHPSQHNTFTGKLTTSMFDAVLRRARELTERPRQELPTPAGKGGASRVAS
jgi:uracil-DNA glycosylase